MIFTPMENSMTVKDEAGSERLELGTVRVADGLTCACGRPLQPYDFTVGAGDTVQAVCAGCHCTAIEIEVVR